MFTSRVRLPVVYTTYAPANNGATDCRDERHGHAPLWPVTNPGCNTIHHYRFCYYYRCRFVRVRFCDCTVVLGEYLGPVGDGRF